MASSFSSKMASTAILFCLLTSSATVSAYIAPQSSPSSHSSLRQCHKPLSTSPLFRKSPTSSSPSLSLVVPTLTRPRQKLYNLKMIEDGNTEEESSSATTSDGTETNTDTNPMQRQESGSAESAVDEKEQSGFITALFLGPPLIFKFLVVLAVKFITDVIVFPLLLLFRFVKMAKNRILDIVLFWTKKADDESGTKGGSSSSMMKGKGVNGSS